MTKAELVNEIAISTGYDKTSIGVVLESFMEIVKKNVTKYLRGFGSFITKTRKAKIARNITMSTSIPVPEHQIAAFKPAAEFAAQVRKGK